MAERDSWAVDGAVDVDDARFAVGASWGANSSAVKARSGFRPATGTPGKVTASGTPDGNVSVAAFQAVISGSRGVQSPYVVTLDSPKAINILSTPADPSNTRHDLIIAQQSDTFHGDASSSFSVTRILGTAAPSPADPTVTGSPDYILLARVRVTAGATAITNAMIDDLRTSSLGNRPLFTVASGGVQPVASTTERAALSPYDGMAIYRTDKEWTEVYDGTGWRVQGTATVSAFANLATDITSPYEGQLAVVTGEANGRLYRRSSSAWIAASTTPRAALRRTTTQSQASSTNVPIQFTTEDEDTHNGHDNSTNPSRWTCPTGWAGRYRIFGGNGWQEVAGGRRWVSWWKNGAVIPGSRANMAPVVGGVTLIDAKTVTVTLAVGDYVEMVAFQDSGSSINTATGTDDQPVMFVEFIGP